MTAWILIALQAFESGFWIGQVGWKRRQRAKIRARLVWGRTPSTSVPVLDERLRKTVGTPTRAQARVASGVVNTVRWITHTRAFELIILKTVRDYWPKGKRLDSHVKLCL